MQFSKKTSKLLPKSTGMRIALAVLVLLAIAGAVFSFIFTRNLAKGWTISALPGNPIMNTPTSAATLSGTLAGTETEDVVAAPQDPGLQAEPWDGMSRINLLLMGLDYRDWEANEVPRTDTMIVFTLDPVSNTAGIVTIPRDLWVNIPDHGYSKINTAYRYGELEKLPGGGPGLAARTVEEFLGIPIHFYAQIDFNAFIKFIDHIGGVKVTIKEEIVVDRLGKWNTVTLPPGDITLPGDYALAYARMRYTANDDFDRSSRQMQIIMGIIDRITQFDLLPGLVAKSPEIYADLSEGIHTNLQLDQAISLALKFMQIPRANIKQVAISTEHVSYGKSPEGWDILKPITDKIRLLRDEVFTTGGPAGPAALGNDLLALVKEENARISIRNGSYTVGLAASTAQYLRDQGLNVVEELESADYTVYTQIFIYGSKPYAVKYLADLMRVTFSTIYYKYDPNAAIDIVIVVGDDWAGNNPLP